jgi:hypothetical protein
MKKLRILKNNNLLLKTKILFRKRNNKIRLNKREKKLKKINNKKILEIFQKN